mmetsp:Transcript_82977/g.231514  ORF Transcript_82977/g.231514 Transcript_82977/m.231514 type:complete len:482 (+) Transcript_82977:95-1540(+)
MCAQGWDGSTAANTFHDVAPPADSVLAMSLQRGYFARTFGYWEALGSGSYGTVFKSWHSVEEKWYAVKLIPAKARVNETIDDLYDEWSGPEVFKHLCSLRSPHVVRYIRCWSELPEDLPCQADCSPMPPQGNKDGDTSRIPHTITASSHPESTVRSGGGFEWTTPTWVNPKTSLGDLETSSSSLTASPKQVHYKVMIFEQMELCEGVTLANWLAQPKHRSGLSTASHDGVLELFSQVMMGLADLHEGGIVHCDVNPSNIMVTMPGAKIKFFDFGSARLRSKVTHRQGSRVPLSPVDQEGSCTELGTPGYAPPEHCMFPAIAPVFKPRSASSLSLGSDGRTKVARPGADIFSAGIVLVELLMVTIMGGPAWSTAMERAKALAQIRTGQGCALPAAVFRSPEIQGWLRQLVLRMVVWDAEVRPSAQEVLDELEVGLWAASRHNPNVGTQHPRSPQLAAMQCPLTAAHNPYIGYFLDHRGLLGV